MQNTLFFNVFPIRFGFLFAHVSGKLSGQQPPNWIRPN